MRFCQRDHETVQLIANEYLKNDLEWSIGYSGGKDSTSLLKLTYNSIKTIKKHHKKINVIYCDTGVEIPIVKSFVEDTFKKLSKESRFYNLPFKFKIISPVLEDRYFVKIIGRGYPSPTNKFRWCTDRLRVKPIQKMLANAQKKNIVLLGIRQGESQERDRVILKHYLENVYYLTQTNYSNTKIFSPILKYSTDDVWDSIKRIKLPESIDGELLYNLYSIVKGDIKFNSFTQTYKEGRFGCWACTVVRKDKAMENLIKGGYDNLVELFNFRNWLYEIRDLSEYRAKYRRNGNKGCGPFTLEARKEILKKLLLAQSKSKLNLISAEEITLIRKLWSLDKKSSNYREN